ncbi:class I SAM-dependent methyltransferase [Streptomyces sp. A7024]|uniref:Class I SAM-dependent methyltransferase n=1 Tax=Streptomyces coryli TaxID=1128680 RepID=A0A6G4UDK1_9ACTN|nr:class I SAM-dependent methyltransferase [Streptomyces coryli]NGN70299.1 class I SAM-dependent methyltransferase [Streptomyces coryli]
MAFVHNRHYHPTLLRRLPRHCDNALDAGCGRGEFAEKVARRARHVDAFDTDPDMVAAAKDRVPDNVTVRQADLLHADLAPGAYDYIASISVLHHMDLEAALATLRDALAPQGTLAVIGCYREATPLDYAVALIASPTNAVARLAHAVARTAPDDSMPVARPSTTLADVREVAARVLPGSQVRRRLFWRYLLTYRKPAG